MSQRQSPMYCKVLTEVEKTIADVLQDLYRSHKDITTKTKTIADVLQDLYRSHKDIATLVNQQECFKSSQQNSQPL